MALSPVFWLCFSGESSKAPDDKVVEIFKNKLPADDLIVVNLVPQGKTIKSLTFVSFKIGIKLDLKAKAMTSKWPVKVRYRKLKKVTAWTTDFVSIDVIPSHRITHESTSTTLINKRAFLSYNDRLNITTIVSLKDLTV